MVVGEAEAVAAAETAGRRVGPDGRQRHAGARFQIRSRLYDSRTPGGYVFDMKTLEVVDGPFTVAHGRGSAAASSGVPTRFSNRKGSNSTSLGLYLAQETYAFRGKSGGKAYRSPGLRLDGFSGRYNSAARARGVVVHGAPYVTARVASGDDRRERGHAGASGAASRGGVPASAGAAGSVDGREPASQGVMRYRSFAASQSARVSSTGGATCLSGRAT